MEKGKNEVPAVKRFLVIIAIDVWIGFLAAAPGVTRLSQKNCIAGLHSQPAGGPFAVFVFCDDALGANIAVINISPGAGPGTIRLDGPRKDWNFWHVNDRVWQEASWATDVTSFAWSSDLRLLYVATSGIYGSGAVYRLDLVARKAEKIFPLPSDGLDPHYGTTARIECVIPETGEVIVSLSRFDPISKHERTTRHTLK
jgi:hypothetical protein